MFDHAGAAVVVDTADPELHRVCTAHVGGAVVAVDLEFVVPDAEDAGKFMMVRVPRHAVDFVVVFLLEHVVLPAPELAVAAAGGDDKVIVHHGCPGG